MTKYAPFALTLILGLAACGESEADADEGAAGEAAPQQSGDANPFVGHYHHQSAENVRLTLNSDMRVRIGPEDSQCLGDYTITDGAIRMTYDDGQDHCMNMTSAGRLSDDGNQLRFGLMATYVRDDAENESF